MLGDQTGVQVVKALAVVCSAAHDDTNMVSKVLIPTIDSMRTLLCLGAVCLLYKLHASMQRWFLSFTWSNGMVLTRHMATGYCCAVMAWHLHDICDWVKLARC